MVPNEVTEPKRANWQRKGPRIRPKLTDDHIESFLDATKQTKRDWLIFRLIIESGFKTGEVVGTYRPKRPGVALDDLDLEEGAIWIHSKMPGAKRFRLLGKRLGKKGYIPVPVSRDLLRELRKFAADEGKTGRLFDISEVMVRYVTKNYAKKARIPQYDLVNPETLREAFERYPSPFKVDVGSFDSKMARRAKRMSQYYEATFCIERILRELVTERMTQNFDKDWWEKKIDPGLQTKVVNNQEDERRTLMFVRSSNPLDYTTLTELISIIDKYWEYFSTDFTMGLSRLRDIMNTLNQLRHVIAHNSEFSDEQKKKFEVVMDDWRAMQP